MKLGTVDSYLLYRQTEDNDSGVQNGGNKDAGLDTERGKLK